MTLKSRVIRAAVAEARTRVIDINPLTEEEKDWQKKGWMGLASKLLAKAWKIIWKFATKFSITDLLGKIFAVTGFFFNFNWNISEKEIEAAIKGSLTRIAGMLGSAAGKTLAHVAVKNIGYGAVAVIFPGPVAALLSAKIAAELKVSLASELSLIITLLTGASLQLAGLWAYGAIKMAIKGSDKSYLEKLKKQGLSTQQIEKAMTDRDKPFILREKWEEFRDWMSGSSEIRKAFVTNLTDDFADSFVEAGYVVGGIIDEYRASTGNQNQIEIEFQPDNTVKVKQVN